MQRKAILIFAAVAMALVVTRASAGEAEERFIRDLYTAIGKSYDASASACTYDGIECQTGRHVAGQISYKIDLENRDLQSAHLPEARGRNLDIYEIDLGNNRRLRGTLPNSWVNIAYLEKIDVSGSGLYGSIPSGWNGMKYLRDVDMSDCYFCYSMPNWNATAMPSLEDINFSRNQLHFFANSFGTFSTNSALRSINLRQNNFCGCKPSTWTSSLLTQAAEAALPGSTSLTCTGRDCAGGPQCRTSGAAGLARTGIVVLVLAVLALFLMA